MKPIHLAIGALLLAPAAGAAEPATDSPFQPGWYVAPMFSYTKADSKRGVDSGTGGALQLGHRGDFAAIEFGGTYTPLGDSARLAGGSLQVVIGAPIPQTFLARFFGLVGIGVMEEKKIPGLKDGKVTSLFGEAGLGYLQPFHLWIDFAVRAEGKFRYDYASPPHPAGAETSFQDLVFNVGVQIPLSHENPPAEIAQGVEVVPPAAATPAEPVAPAPVETLVLEGVTFETNSAELRTESFPVLDDAAAKLAKRPDTQVEVGGHTDSTGDDGYNQQLSQRRAETVRNYLVEHGVAAEHLTAKGYGESQPVAGNDTAAGRAKNRRVELKIESSPAASTATP